MCLGVRFSYIAVPSWLSFIVRRRPARLAFLRGLCDSVVIFHHRGTEATESFVGGFQRGADFLFVCLAWFAVIVPGAVAGPVSRRVRTDLSGNF